MCGAWNFRGNGKLFSIFNFQTKEIDWVLKSEKRNWGAAQLICVHWWFVLSDLKLFALSLLSFNRHKDLLSSIIQQHNRQNWEFLPGIPSRCLTLEHQTMELHLKGLFIPNRAALCEHCGSTPVGHCSQNSWDLVDLFSANGLWPMYSGPVSIGAQSKCNDNKC